MKVVNRINEKKKKRRCTSTAINCYIAQKSFMATKLGKTFNQLPKASIRKFAESFLINLPEDALVKLMEGLNFELRSIISSAILFMKRQNREIFTVEDFNKGVRMLSKPAIGYSGSPVLYSYKAIQPKTEESETYVNLVSIAKSSVKSYQTLQPYVECSWGVIENKACAPCYFDNTVSFTVDTSEDVIVPDELVKYFDKITEIIHCGPLSAFELIISDLRVNPYIVTILPKIVCFLRSSIEVFRNDFYVLSKLLQTIEALFVNPYLYIGHEPYLPTLVDCVINCLLMPLSDVENSNLEQHWIVKDSAAELLAQMVNEWASPVNKLYPFTFDTLERVYGNFDDSTFQPEAFCCHYGALRGIMAFGVEAMDKRIYPYMPNYIVCVQRILRVSSRSNAQIREKTQAVYSTLLEVAVKMTAFFSKEIQEMKDKPDYRTAVTVDHISSKLLRTNYDVHKNKNDLLNLSNNESENFQEKVKHLQDMYELFLSHFGSHFIERLSLISTIDIASLLSTSGGNKNMSFNQNYENNEKYFKSFKERPIQEIYERNNKKNALSQFLCNESAYHCKQDDGCPGDDSISSNDSLFPCDETKSEHVTKCFTNFSNLFQYENNELNSESVIQYSPCYSNKPVPLANFKNNDSSPSNIGHGVEDSDRCTTTDDGDVANTNKQNFEVTKISGEKQIKLTLRVRGKK